MKSLRHYVFETLVRAYPAKKGKGRWLNLIYRTLDIKPYGFGKPSHVGKYQILLDPGDRCDQLFYFRIIGEDHYPLFGSVLRPGDTVIDIGANSGHFAASCANFVNPGGAVHALEANPHLVSRLKESFRSTPDVIVHYGAAGSTNGRTAFSIATFSGWSSLRPNKTFDEQERVTVDQITIDHLIVKMQIQKIRLLKLDIEGGEFDALRGATYVLSSGIIDYVFTEVEPDRMGAFGWSAEELMALMGSSGYIPVACKFGRTFVPVAPDTPIGNEPCDVLFCRASLAEETIARLFH